MTTLKQAKTLLSVAGVSLRKRDGEYRVCVRGHDEAKAYYTGDINDALSTGLAMTDPVIFATYFQREA